MTAQAGSLNLFTRASRGRPLRAAVGLLQEYLTFFAAVGFAITLTLTRFPLMLVDRAFGLRIRERCIDLIARISPG